MELRDQIVQVIQQVAADGGKTLAEPLGDDTVLLQSGLDSLEFAIIVARLEDQLGADPFSATSVPIYPRTLGEFVAIYTAHFSKTR